MVLNAHDIQNQVWQPGISLSGRRKLARLGNVDNDGLQLTAGVDGSTTSNGTNVLTKLLPVAAMLSSD
jgi:hypothetical protein